MFQWSLLIQTTSRRHAIQATRRGRFEGSSEIRLGNKPDDHVAVAEQLVAGIKQYRDVFYETIFVFIIPALSVSYLHRDARSAMTSASSSHRVGPHHTHQHHHSLFCSPSLPFILFSISSI